MPPPLALTTTQDLQYAGHVYDPLISGDEKGQLASNRSLVESWSISEDARTLTVKRMLDQEGGGAG